MRHSRLSHMVSMNQDRIVQEAARRYAQLQSARCSQAEQQELRTWEQENPEQHDASKLAQRVLSGIDQLAANPDFARKLQAMTEEALAAYEPAAPTSTPATRWRWAASIAASVAMAVGSWLLYSQHSAAQLGAAIYETTGQSRRSITLDDGSVVDLDVGTRIAVRMSSAHRDIELLSGRALFAVAHDAGRPFTVTADGSRTTALGTHFQVEKELDRVVVTLAEGSVAVESRQRADAEPWQERLQPGDQLSIDTSTAGRSRHFVDTQLVTSWTLGRHVFRGTPLHEALDEVNRYASKKVRLGDASLADLPVAGNFVAGDSELVVEAFAAVLPLRVVEGGEHEIILFRRYGE